ncbi:MAG: prolyl oligopeptidase family serine peptidase [Prochlorotrichaceae cyanobacterium]
MAQPFTYPPVSLSDRVDDYHGTIVADPYRNLEDPASSETQAWIAAQNTLTDQFLADAPHRQAIHDRLTALWNYERYSTPRWRTLENGEKRYFYFKNDGLQNQSLLYVQDSLNGEPRILLDPNTLSEDGTIALGNWSVSKNGEWLAYSLAESGSDWQTWQVREVKTGVDQPDCLRWSKFSGATWTPDHQGFFYGRYTEPDPQRSLEEVNYFQKLYYHRLGTDQSQDQLIYDRPDQKEWGFGSSVSEDGQYLIISVWLGTDSRNLIFYQDLQQPEGTVQELIATFAAGFHFLESEGSTFWFWTDWNAPKGRVVAIDLAQVSIGTALADLPWQEVIPEAEETLEFAHLVHHQWITGYLKDAASQVKRWTLTGQPLGIVELPGIGSVEGFGGKREDTETFYSFTSFTTPTTIYRYDLTTGESTLFRQPQVDFDPAAYDTQQVFCTSKDGTQIPLFLTYRKGLQLNGENPTYLYAYGGFNISLSPSFSPSLLAWLERGGVYVQAVLRGGGEYGEAWHQAGMKHQKQNVFDDFISAAEWLIAQGYTQSRRLAIAGGSNGGLLVGACLTQRPELFGAALPAVGVMDMLRFHQFTIGWAWCSEYGCADNPEDFPVLYAYSPLHNIKAGVEYPATLVTTADHDDRVVPAHSFKFTAALQAAQGGDQPILIRVETKAGHGAGKPVTKRIEEQADRWAFLFKVFDF